MNEPSPSANPHSLRRLAAADPDYFPFAEQHQELSSLSLSPNEETELTLDLATLFQQLPEQSLALTRLNRNTREAAFDAGLASVPILLAAAFLLRTHFRIKRASNGKWEFLVEHKPGDSKLVGALLAKIGQLLSRA